VAVPAAIYGVGWLRKDNYDKDSGLLAGEAVADSFLLNISFKAITARRQPLSYYGNGPYTDSFFNGSHNPFHSGDFSPITQWPQPPWLRFWRTDTGNTAGFRSWLTASRE
jgi:hypothetical protein